MFKLKVTIALCCIFCITESLLASASKALTSITKMVPKEMVMNDGTLILSNSPELVKEPGILYQDVLAGKGRLLFHHVNGTISSDKRLSVVVENTTDQMQMLMVEKKAIIPPSYDYLKAGEALLLEYYKEKPMEVHFIATNGRMILYDSGDDRWPVQTVITGMVDFEVTGKVKVTFAMMDRKTQDDLMELKKLNRDLAPRGTFNTLTKYQCLLLPWNKNGYYLIEEDRKKWVRGKDAMIDQIAINYGNYGIMYKITFIAMVDTKILICPRGGIFQGATRWDNGEVVSIKKPHVFKLYKEYVELGEIKAGNVRTLEYFLPNGSAAPVLLEFKIK